jgi:Na+-driven multidrug efflux pump
MGIVWEVFEASTEGIGDAAAIRISFFLAEGQPVQAKILSNKVAFLALVEALVATSIFLMAGPNISVSLTTDSTLENLLNDLVGMTGLANVAMAFAQVYWSLVGAQGRFALAASTILLCRWLVTMPLAMSFIFGLGYDLRAVAGSIAIGYSTAASFLAYCVYHSDWESLSLAAQEQAYPAEDENMLDSSLDGEEEDSSEDDDSSVGMGIHA